LYKGAIGLEKGGVETISLLRIASGFGLACLTECDADHATPGLLMDGGVSGVFPDKLLIGLHGTGDVSPPHGKGGTLPESAGVELSLLWVVLNQGAPLDEGDLMMPLSLLQGGQTGEGSRGEGREMGEVGADSLKRRKWRFLAEGACGLDPTLNGALDNKALVPKGGGEELQGHPLDILEALHA